MGGGDPIATYGEHLQTPCYYGEIFENRKKVSNTLLDPGIESKSPCSRSCYHSANEPQQSKIRSNFLNVNSL
uniref:SFRICE_009368 n=1 Tax=Spodoptera frugiperda TaxID=7108 RepID=A0A2H1WZ11_SPOFR